MMVWRVRSKALSEERMVDWPVEGTVRIMTLEKEITSDMEKVMRRRVLPLMAPVDLRRPLERTALACRGCVG